MDLGLKDKVVIVTAASRGLGKAAALAFAREDAKLAICSRSETLLDTADEIRSQTGVDVLAIRMDLNQPAQIRALVDSTLEHFGQLDILVLNAGGPKPGDFLSLTPEDWRAAFNLTMMSAVHLCYAVVPIMLQAGTGSIVASQSVSVKEPIENLILSNSLRMAVIGLLKSLANELGPRGIRVNSINPSWTWTERVEQLRQDRATRNGTSIEEESKKITASIPLGRMGRVEEYGKAIAWLASPAASFIHGHALMFDGGTIRATL